jgi:hypothetical protein
MLRAAGGGSRYCHACFSGKYPVPVEDDIVKLRHASPMAASKA